MKRLFISDLHLDLGQKELTQGFHQFLEEQCKTIDSLHILGDLFEVWLGDDDDSPFNREIIAALAQLTCKVYIMHGNRDFLIGTDFCRSINATLLDDPCLIELPQGPALLMHGDSLCTRDENYMKARKVLRSEAFQADLLSKTIAERQQIAQQIRGESQQLKRETAADIMDVTMDEVTAVMRQTNVLILIHGHTHRPAIHDLAIEGVDAKRYVLGDWQTSMQYLEVTDTEINLKLYPFT
jgi:UDP-2,3-diacylglucosamine hydrolase